MAAASTDRAAVARPRKTPTERAQMDLDAAVKRRDTLAAKVAKLEESIAPARAELAQATALADYHAKNPLLNPAPESPDEEDEDDGSAEAGEELAQSHDEG